jgi:hypothetical protein
MAQRLRDAVGAMPAGDQDSVHEWLRTLGGDALLQMDIPRLDRAGLSVRLARAGGA